MGSEERLQAVKIISGVVDGLGLWQARLETAAGNGGHTVSASCNSRLHLGHCCQWGQPMHPNGSYSKKDQQHSWCTLCIE